MKKTFALLWFLVGIAVGSSATWIASEKFKGKEDVPRYATIDVLDDRPEQWLLPPDAPFAEIFPDPIAQSILEEPFSITLHESSASGPDAITYGEHSFSKSGTMVTAKEVLYTVRSLSSYRSVTMCEFKPIVMLRITRDGQDLDFLFCFSCDDVYLYCGGAEWNVGMSDIGRRCFVRYFHKILPNNPALKSVYDAYPK